MYKVVIADDEVWIVFGIKKLIHRSGEPFVVTGEASNGIQAYDLVREMKPDILITDIRMPGLNGLELMKKLKEEKIYVSVIFISGYAEFSYAREALQMGAFDYLLKPVESEELTALLEKWRLQKEKLKMDSVDNEKEQNITDPRIKKILDEINQNYAGNLSLGALAEQYNMSIGHLSTLIRKEAGMSFSEYVTQKRMEDAKKLLYREELSIEEIAELSGYHDYFYFIKAFKKYTGKSPSVYRKNYEE